MVIYSIWLKNAYGYSESKASIERGSYLEMVERDFAENISDVELASGVMTKEADATKMQWSTSIKKKEEKFLRSG